MIRLPAVILAMIFILLSTVAIHAQAARIGTYNQPSEPPLVRQGELALKLAPALKLGFPQSEAEAMGRLTDAGITPRRGWQGEEPVTPDLVGELQELIAKAADERKIPLDRFAAMERLADVTAALDLPVQPGGGVNDAVAETDPEVFSGSSTEEEFYYTGSPPAVTYYAPPPNYYNSYVWVPYPFWHYGVQFSGYYILRDFHRPHHIGNKSVLVPNRRGEAKFIHGHHHRGHVVHGGKSGGIKVSNDQPKTPGWYIPPSGVHRINSPPATAPNKPEPNAERLHHHQQGEYRGTSSHGGNRSQIIHYRNSDHYREVSGTRRGQTFKGTDWGSGRSFIHPSNGGWVNRGVRR